MFSNWKSDTNVLVELVHLVEVTRSHGYLISQAYILTNNNRYLNSSCSKILDINFDKLFLISEPSWVWGPRNIYCLTDHGFLLYPWKSFRIVVLYACELRILPCFVGLKWNVAPLKPILSPQDLCSALANDDAWCCQLSRVLRICNILERIIWSRYSVSYSESRSFYRTWSIKQFRRSFHSNRFSAATMFQHR
jgi:hypothetical protein